MKTFVELTLLTLQRLHISKQLLHYYNYSFITIFPLIPSRLQAAKVPWLRPWR